MTMATWTGRQERYRLRTVNVAAAGPNAAFDAADPALNTDASINADVIFRVRLTIEETAGGAAQKTIQLRYQLNGAGGYQVITGSTPIQVVSVTGIANDDLTTALLGGTGAFLAGYADATDNLMPSAGNQSWTGSQYSEYELALRLDSAQIAHGNTIDLRLYESSGTALGSYTRTPRVTAVVSAQNVTRSVTDTLAPTDTAGVGVDRILAADSMALLDAVSPQSVVARSVTDALALDDVGAFDVLATSDLLALTDVVSYQIAPAVLVQEGFRGYADDAGLGAATPKALENAGWTQPVGEAFRVRFVIRHTAGSALVNFDLPLEYNRNGQGWKVAGAPWHLRRAVREATFTPTARINPPFGWKTVFKPDGMTMYLGESPSSLSYNRITQYTLSTPWDITTAVYADKFHTDRVDVFWGGQRNWIDFVLDPTGSVLFEVGHADATGQGVVVQYALSTPWDISTTTYVATGTAISPQVTTGDSGLFVSPDGTTLITSRSGQNFFRYTMSTPWDVTTLTHVQTVAMTAAMKPSGAWPLSLWFSSDGTRMFTAYPFDPPRPRRFALSTPWDISTATFVDELSDTTERLDGISSDPTGTMLFVSDQYTAAQPQIVAFRFPGAVARATASPWASDGEATSRQLTSGAGVFAAGSFDEADGLATVVSLEAGQLTEVEYSLALPSDDVAPGDTIQLRVNPEWMESWSQIPTLAAASSVVDTTRPAAILVPLG